MKKNFVLFLITALSILIGYLLGNTKEVLNTEYAGESRVNRLERLLTYIADDYVEKINTDSLVGVVIEDIVDRLDPHSVYIPSSERQMIVENMQGNFYGIGVSFFLVKDTVTIIRVIKGGPSEKAGLLAGDRILVANQDTLFQKKYSANKIMSILKGKPGTDVKLKLYRKSEDVIVDVSLKRGKVPLESVESYYMLNNSIGYLKINRFSQTTFDEFELAIQSLLSEGMDKMILDLRGNPGGYLHSAKQISNAFLSKNQKIVITKSNMGEEETSTAKGDGVFQKGGLIVLVNEQSASASEIVAGAIQDNDRGWIIGRRTFGKGLVQKQMPLGGGDAVRLTIAKYFTPSGRSIQKPYSNNRKDYYEDLNKRFENGEMADEKKIPIIDSLAFKTPRGKTVYGGGGIIPDKYISNENTQEEEWNDLILNSPLISNFVFNKLDQNRKGFSKLEEVQLLNNKSSSILPSYQEFYEYCKTKGVEFKNGEKETLKAIRANLALQLFGENTFNRIKNQEDVFIERAIKTLDSL